jgi:hypothetical protein
VSVRLSCALLCDAATVREGLINILGGGVSRVTRPALPAPLGVSLALVVDQHRTEMGREHRLDVLVLSEDGVELARANLTWRPDRLPEDLATDYPFPVIVPLHAVALPTYGRYSVELLIDDVHQVTLPFTLVNE